MHKIKEDIFWVGHIDWTLRNFHGYSTPSGSTYNAYLILDEKPTLIDTVKYYGVDEMIEQIKEIIDPSKIEIIISNHTEMDHSGSIDKLLEYCPNAQVVCSPKGEEGLRKHFRKDWNFKIVNTSDTINIGKRDLQFLLMPMVHWPDSMATYSASDKILFPNDAFGQHFASNERFADEIGFDAIFPEAAKYYANIVLPYGQQVLKALEAAGIPGASPERTLGDLAQANAMTASALYDRIVGKSKQVRSEGFGRTTLAVIAEEAGISPQSLQLALSSRGIEAETGETMRAIAAKNGAEVQELRNVIEEIVR